MTIEDAWTEVQALFDEDVLGDKCLEVARDLALESLREVKERISQLIKDSPPTDCTKAQLQAYNDALDIVQDAIWEVEDLRSGNDERQPSSNQRTAWECPSCRQAVTGDHTCLAGK
ncbi:MAG: hypothetical protein ACE5IZ_01195 [Dehalococcoidia bacterium]